MYRYLCIIIIRGLIIGIQFINEGKYSKQKRNNYIDFCEIYLLILEDENEQIFKIVGIIKDVRVENIRSDELKCQCCVFKGEFIVLLGFIQVDKFIVLFNIY